MLTHRDGTANARIAVVRQKILCLQNQKTTRHVYARARRPTNIMKTFINRSTSLMAATGIAVLGIAGLGAQDEPGGLTDKPGRVTDRDPATKTQEAQEQTFRGKLVPLVAYMAKHDRKTGEATSSTEPQADDPSATRRAAAAENQPLGFLVSSDAQTPAGQTQDKLCVLLFEPENQHLKTKAESLCQAHEKKSKAEASAITDDEVDDVAGVDDDADTTATADTKKKHEVAITGKRVTRDGLTVIFVRNIESCQRDQ